MRILSLIVLSMVLFGCGSGMNGNYIMWSNGGQYFTQCGSGSNGSYDYVNVSLAQSGSQLSGSFTSVATGVSGSLQGSMSGSNIQMYLMPTTGGSGNGYITATGTWTNGYAQFSVVNPSCGGAAAQATMIKP